MQTWTGQVIASHTTYVSASSDASRLKRADHDWVRGRLDSRQPRDRAASEVLAVEAGERRQRFEIGHGLSAGFCDRCVKRDWSPSKATGYFGDPGGAQAGQQFENQMRQPLIGGSAPNIDDALAVNRRLAGRHP